MYVTTWVAIITETFVIDWERATQLMFCQYHHISVPVPLPAQCSVYSVNVLSHSHVTSYFEIWCKHVYVIVNIILLRLDYILILYNWYIIFGINIFIVSTKLFVCEVWIGINFAYHFRRRQGQNNNPTSTTIPHLICSIFIIFIVVAQYGRSSECRGRY